MNKLSVDLVICTRGRGEAACETLERSAADSHVFNELIVIDNNAEPMPGASRQKLESLKARVAHEPKPGLSVARTAGLSASRADYVWFIDDDASLVPGFAENARRHLLALESMNSEDRPVAGGGLILAASTGRSPSDIGSFELGLLSCMPPGSRFGQPWGANMFVDRAAALAVGGFKLVLSWANLGDEDELFQRLHKDQSVPRRQFYFADGCGVNHWIPDSRRELKWLLPRAYKGGRVNYFVYQSFSAKEFREVLRGLGSEKFKETLLKAGFVSGKLAQKLFPLAA